MFEALVVSLFLTAQLALVGVVVFQFRAASKAKPGLPLSIRANGLVFLFKPDLWHVEARRDWHRHFACLAAFVATLAGSLGIARLADWMASL